MSKIIVTMLGTTAGVPTRERAHPSIHLSYDDGEETTYLFDCGEGTQRQMLFAGLNIMRIDQIFITHWHGDHCLGIPGIVDSMGFEGRENAIDIFAPEARRVAKCFAFSHSMGKFKVNAHNVPLKKGALVFEADRFRIVSTPVKHSVPAVAYALEEKDKLSIDAEKAAGLGLPDKGELYSELKKKGRVSFNGRDINLEDVSVKKKGKKVVYSGDTEVCDNLSDLARGADLLIQDCTYFSEMGSNRPYRHASLPEIIEMIERESIKKVILTHISRKFQDTEELKEIVKERGNVRVAEDLMKVSV